MLVNPNKTKGELTIFFSPTHRLFNINIWKGGWIYRKHLRTQSINALIS